MANYPHNPYEPDNLIDGISLSNNIEKHAAPDSFQDFYPTYLTPTKHYEFYSTQSVLPSLIKIKNIYKNAPYEIKEDDQGRKYAEGHLPRLLLKIYEPSLYQHSLSLNPSYYNQPHTDKSLLQVRRTMMNTLNNIKVADIDCDCINKPAYERVFPDAIYDLDSMCYNSCKHTVFAAAKRQIKSAPTPDPEVAKDFVNYAKNIIDKEIGEDLDHFGYSFNQWYNHLPRKKQNLMDKVINAITFNNVDLLTEKEINRIARWNEKLSSLNPIYTGICKIELQNLDGKPRMVCSIPDLIKFTMGAVTWHLEEICAHKLHGYCGGKNLDQMADTINGYISKGFTRVVEGDGSGFDNTQDVMLKEIDRYIYQRVANSVYHTQSASKWKELFLRFSQSYYKTMNIEYIDKQTKKKKTLLSYSVLGTVFSGDCDTTLANTIRMALYNRYVMDKAGYKYGTDYVAFSKGDDFTTMFNPTHITDDQVEKAYWKYFLPKPEAPNDKYDNRSFGLGQICKFLEFGWPNSIKFCSLRAWYINKEETKIRLTRDPAKFLTLSKYSRKMKSYTPMQKLSYLHDQIVALETSYKGLHYFDTMCMLYNSAYTTLMNQYKITKNEVTTYSNKHKNNDSRKTLALEDPDSIDCIKYRDQVVLITDNYWDSMKAVEKVSHRVYTQEQLDIVNDQIDIEFDPQELKQLLAPNKNL